MKKITVWILLVALLVTGCSTGKSENVETAAFTVIVTDLDGSETTFSYTADTSKSVGEVLLAEGLIDGEDSEYGLYVTTVNGITADWDADQTYWSFYIDGEYATTGVDSTAITDGASYTLALTQG